MSLGVRESNASGGVMKVIARIIGTAALSIVGGAAAALVSTGTAAAATPTVSNAVVYVRGGDLFSSKGAAETKIADGNYARPRFSPDGTKLVALRDGQLWLMKADGSGKRRLTTRAAAGASWSPDSAWIAFASQSCTGGPGVFRINVKLGGAPEALFPAECRTEALPAEPAAAPAGAGTLTDRLRYDDAVAWSPDGTQVAFRGGLCESTYDACLSIGTIASGRERTVAAFGGGSLQTSGFAVVPTWRADGTKLAYTAYQQGETAADDKPVHVVEFDPATGAKRDLGAAQDRELAYLGASKAVLTGQHLGGSYIFVLDLATGKRTPFHAGSQPTVQP